MVELCAGVSADATADRSFPKSHRLQTTEGFSLVFADRRCLRGEIFDLHYRPRDPGAIGQPLAARLGVVIAKKLAHKAVQRNLLKRLARESFRLVRRELPAYDLVLRLARAPGESSDRVARSTWRGDIERLLGRLPR